MNDPPVAEPSQAAWDDFYERIARVAKDILAPYSLPEDFREKVVQKVAIEIWEAQNMEDVVADSYIAQRMLWRYRDLIRSQPNEDSLDALIESRPDLPIFDEETPEERYLFEEEIQEALAGLTLEERMVVQGFRWGYTAAEIADDLIKSTSWVYKVWRRVMHKLQTREYA